MSEVEQTEQDLKELEAFIVNNQDLERLEALLDQFNIFEAVGMKRQEIRHSRFLAFLLDPNEIHGLGDTFAKRLLQQVLMSTPDVSAPVTPVELSLWDLGKMEVRREWNYIDIFLLDEQNRLAIFIEHKVDTGEHSDQLRRYYETVQQHYPDHKAIGLYLTPTGDEPSYEAYLPLSYGLVCEVLDDLANNQLSVLNKDLQILITHYTEMLRRHIVGDSETARLSRQIYRKLQRAIDLIYEHRPDIQADIQSVVEDFVNKEPRLNLWSNKSKSKIKFGVRDWNTPALHILWFEAWNYPGSLELKGFVGPGAKDIRGGLFEIVRNNPEVFSGANSNLGGKWSNVFSRPFLKQEMYEDADQKEREEKIRRHWTEFLEEDLPRIDAALKQESWIWQETDGSE